jgi:hypothetical protein
MRDEHMTEGITADIEKKVIRWLFVACAIGAVLLTTWIWSVL